MEKVVKVELVPKSLALDEIGHLVLHLGGGIAGIFWQSVILNFNFLSTLYSWSQVLIMAQSSPFWILLT